MRALTTSNSDKGSPFLSTLFLSKNTNLVHLGQLTDSSVAISSPLALMHFTDIRLSQLLRVHLDGIPLDLASKLLPWKTWSHFSLLSHIHLHARSQQKYAKNTHSTKQLNIGEAGLQHLTSHLKTALNKLNWQPQGTEWAKWLFRTNYSDSSFAYKKRLVRLITSKEKPEIVWDSRCQHGEFSQNNRRKGQPSNCLRCRPGCCRKALYRKQAAKHLATFARSTNQVRLLAGKNRKRRNLPERGPADMILALALIHHLAISNNLPLKLIADFLSQNCRTLLIEFVPKTDSQVQKLLATRPDIFPEYNQATFETIFSTVFIIEGIYPISESKRTLYFMRVKSWQFSKE